DAELVAGRDEGLPRGAEPRALVRGAGELEGHAGGEDVRAAPGQPERAQPGRVQDLELVEARADRLGALDGQDRGERSVVLVELVRVRDQAQDAGAGEPV